MFGGAFAARIKTGGRADLDPTERQSIMSLTTDFVPRREGDMDEFVRNFDARITANPTQVGLTAPLALAFHNLVVAWDAAFAVTKNRGTRSESAVIVKNEAKFLMLKNLRELARIVQAYPGTTNEMRSLLGLTVPSQRQPQPVPSTMPQLQIKKVERNVVSIRLRDADNPTRARPPFAKSAAVFSYVGENPPATGDGWYFQGGTTRSIVDVLFPATLPIGTKVWITALWKNERDQIGPASTPVPVLLMGGGVLPGVQSGADESSMAIAA